MCVCACVCVRVVEVEVDDEIGRDGKCNKNSFAKCSVTNHLLSLSPAWPSLVYLLGFSA